MLFEEFFKKKKINLTALQQGDPAIFLEFKEHYEQMGEKSFDHTKKYWFNKLRRLYPLPPEVKAEKPRMENQLAEQTVSDTLTEPTPRAAAPQLGFKPKFKAGTTMPPKPAEETPAENIPAQPAAPVEEKPTETSDATAAPKLGFKPKFKAALAKPAAEEQPNTSSAPQEAPAANAPATEKPAEEAPATPKPAYKPRFQAKNLPPKPAATESVTPAENEAAATNQDSESTATEPSRPTSGDAGTASTDAPETAVPKLGFKPRFKASAPPKVIEESNPETASVPQPPVQEDPIQDTKTEPTTDTPAAKPAYKPRFNPKMVKPKPPQEGDE